MKRLLLIFLLSLSLLIADNPRGDDDDDGGKLDDIERDIESGNGNYEAIFDILIFLIIHFPDLFIGLSELLFNSSEQIEDISFSKYPYYYSSDGLYSTSSTFTSAGNFKISYLHESINLHGYEFQTTLYPSRNFSFDLSIKNYGENYGLESDDAILADAFLNWQRVRYEYFDLRWGLGAKYFRNNDQFFGPAYNIAFDIYGLNPFSVNFQYTGAYINNSYINDLNVDLNYHSRHLMLFIGYDYFGTENVSINAFKIGAGINF